MTPETKLFHLYVILSKSVIFTHIGHISKSGVVVYMSEIDAEWRQTNN